MKKRMRSKGIRLKKREKKGSSLAMTRGEGTGVEEH